MLMHKTFLVLYLLLSYNGVRGVTTKSKLNDLELEEQLKLLNKPAIKTIKTIYGDIYNCVDFYKQPAFDHPLLRNHYFHPEMKPTLSRTKKNSRNSTTNELSTIWLNGESCPFGTVPIKRITKDDLIRQNHMPPPEDVVTFDAQAIANNNSMSKSRYRSLQGGYKVAIVRTPDNPRNKFGGGAMVTCIWNPRVEGQQHSASRLKIQKGSDIVQAGWRVDPILYGDTKTRLFIHFQAGNTNCFNMLCPGFVLVNKDIPIDKALHTSQIGGKGVWEQTISIDRDLINGNWWLLLEREYIQIGFWPQRIFNGLKSFATNVEWGGVVYSPPGVPEPPMGCGLFPSIDSSRAGYCRGITVLNDKGDTIDIKTITHVDNSHLYDVFDFPQFIPGKYQHWALYGGPGENKKV